MSWELVKRWNSVVKNEDIVYHLGDVAFGLERNKGALTQLISQLHGKKILIKGNHDHETNEFYLNLGFDEVHDDSILLDTCVLSHAPVLNTKIFNIHGHTHSKPHRMEDIEVDSSKYFNASIECLPDFKPLLLAEILKGVSNPLL